MVGKISRVSSQKSGQEAGARRVRAQLAHQMRALLSPLPGVSVQATLIVILTPVIITTIIACRARKMPLSSVEHA